MLIKAGYVYNFCLFVEWPEGTANPGEPFVIGVAGKQSLLPLIEKAVEKKRINTRTVVVRKVGKPIEARSVHALFLDFSDLEKAQPFLTETQRLPVLTIGDAPGFTGKGGMINFVIDDNRVRYEINIEAARAAGLDVRSKLLALARATYGR